MTEARRLFTEPGQRTTVVSHTDLQREDKQRDYSHDCDNLFPSCWEDKNLQKK